MWTPQYVKCEPPNHAFTLWWKNESLNANKLSFVSSMVVVTPNSQSFNEIVSSRRWKVHEPQILHVGYLAWQILGILGSQIEIERISSMASIPTCLKKCLLGAKNLEKLVLIHKNWPHHARLDDKMVEGSASYIFCNRRCFLG